MTKEEKEARDAMKVAIMAMKMAAEFATKTTELYADMILDALERVENE